MITTILTSIMSDKLAGMVAPFAKIGLVLLAWFAFSQHYIGVGKNKIRADIAVKVEEATAREHERYLEREASTRESYQVALTAALEARTAAPQIIREIRNAPATTCSAEPVGIERVRLLNAAIAGYRDQDPAAGQPAG